jgi:hypothetical protein
MKAKGIKDLAIKSNALKQIDLMNLVNYVV